MRVLQLGPFPPPNGGVQTNLVAIRRGLLKAGHTCDVINLTRFRRPDADGVYYPPNPAAVLSLIARLRFDVIHMHVGGELHPRLLFLAMLCARKPGIKALLTFHSGGYPSSPGGQSARPFTLRGMALRSFDGLIAVNAELAALFERFGVPPERIRLISPFSIEPPPPGTSLPEDVERFYQSHNPVLFSGGWLEPEYDFPIQIEALAAIRQAYPSAGLVIAGEGRLEAELKAQIAASPYSADVLLPGDLPHESALRAIERAGAYLRTSLFDGDSISVREALYLGTPVIATDNGMRPAGVRLIPRSNFPALCDAILETLRAPAARRPRPGDGQENVRAVIDFYAALLTSRAPRHMGGFSGVI